MSKLAVRYWSLARPARQARQDNTVNLAMPCDCFKKTGLDFAMSCLEQNDSAQVAAVFRLQKPPCQRMLCTAVLLSRFFAPCTLFTVCLNAIPAPRHLYVSQDCLTPKAHLCIERSIYEQFKCVTLCFQSPHSRKPKNSRPRRWGKEFPTGWEPLLYRDLRAERKKSTGRKLEGRRLWVGRGGVRHG